MIEPSAATEGDGSAVASPCINVCTLQEGLGAGCFRTIDEIARWATAGDTGKRLILAAAARRKTRSSPVP